MLPQLHKSNDVELGANFSITSPTDANVLEDCNSRQFEQVMHGMMMEMEAGNLVDDINKGDLSQSERGQVLDMVMCIMNASQCKAFLQELSITLTTQQINLLVSVYT